MGSNIPGANFKSVLFKHKKALFWRDYWYDGQNDDKIRVINEFA